MKGILITFDGPEGSGKSTHSKGLYNFLKKKGYSVLHLREPGGTEISEAIRRVLLNPKYGEMTSQTEVLLYLASRAQLVKQKIIPALEKGKIVICDRFHDATLVYQGYGEGIDFFLLESLGRFVCCGLAPRLTFFLDVEPKEGLKRSNSDDRVEKKDLAFHRRVRAGYLELARKNRKRVFLIKTNKKTETIAKIIQSKTLEILGSC